MFIMYFVSNVFLKRSSKSTPKSANQSHMQQNCFLPGQPINLFAFLSETTLPDSQNASFLFHDQGLLFMDWNSGSKLPYIHEHTISTSDSLVNNGSLFLITCLSKNDTLPTFSPSAGYSSDYHSCVVHELTKKQTIKRSLRKNLLSGEQSQTIAEDIIVSHWHPNITISPVYDNRSLDITTLPPFVSSQISLTSDDRGYFPIVYISDYWNLKSDYKPISPDNRTLNLTVIVSPLNFFKWQLYLGLSTKNQFSFMPDSDANEDSLKQLLLDTPVYLLILTFVITLTHSFFEFLAFKNDIQFWKNRNDLTGLSVSGILFGLFQSVVVLLYIFDNDANVMLIVGAAIGCLIDAWKITKVIDISLDFVNLLGPFPRLVFKDKSTYVESNTRQYDRVALKYLSIVLFPAFIAYSSYSMIYNEHKGWYSFALSIVYGFLLMFGFIMMTPQLFINYKLKSVAHLPWRMLTYKALNTFIDDIFAFIIRTPTMYRLGCLRDDVVFFVYLYQRWIYPIDKKRVNEFGGTGEEVVTGREKQD